MTGPLERDAAMPVRLRKLSARFRRRRDHLTGIAPIYKVSFDGSPELIGTGFWVTEHGHLVTARHVIEDNIGPNGVDRGPIYAIQTLRTRNVVVRVLRRSDMHDKFDLALSETQACDDSEEERTEPLPMTLVEPAVGHSIYTHAFLSPDQNFSSEKYMGMSTATFDGAFAIPVLGLTYELSFMARVGRGYVKQIFETLRDRVMLPFPCFESDVPVYGANSGGPVLDERGRICAINCSSFQGAAASFHIPLRAILDLRASDVELIPEDPVPRNRSVFELGLSRRAMFHPTLPKAFVPLVARMLLWPYHVWLDAESWVRWHFRRARR